MYRAKDAPEAARLLADQHYDVLISYIKMPGNSKWQLVLETKGSRRGCRSYS